MQTEKVTRRYSALCMTGQPQLCVEPGCEGPSHGEIALKNSAGGSRNDIIMGTAYHCYNSFSSGRIEYDYDLTNTLALALHLLGVNPSKEEVRAITNAIVNMAAQGAWSNRLIDEAIKSAG